MFNFFKNKNGNINAPSKVLVFAIAFLIIFSGVLFAQTDTASARLLDEGVAADPPPPVAEAVEPGWVEAGFIAATNTFLTQISLAMLQLSSWVLWAAAEILQTVIHYSVVDVDEYIDSEGVTQTWETFRDIANMFFIFMILYAAINIILGTGDSNLKKLLSRIVIVALLINFSFFFTKVAIDASNILAISFYNQIISTSCGTSGAPASNIGAVFVCKMGLTSFWSSETLRNIGGATGGGWGSSLKILTMGVMGSVFFLIAAFVFLAAGVMFIARFVKLIYLFILSPVAFASRALDQEKRWKEWVKGLMDVCIFPPVFMILTWATLKVLNSVVVNLNQTKLVEAVIGTESGRPADGAGAVIVNFAIIIGLMLGTLIISKESGKSGAGWGLKMLDKGTSKLQGFVGRNTIGRAGLALDKYAEKKPGGDSRVGRYLRDYTTGAVANSKFGGSISRKDDAKRVKDLKSDIATSARKRENISILDKNRTAAAGTPARQEIEKVLSGMSNKELEDAGFKNIKAHVQTLNTSQLEHILEKSEKFNEVEKAQIREARFAPLKGALSTSISTAASPTATAAEKAAAKKAAKDAVRALSEKEVELHGPFDATSPEHQEFIGHMKPPQVESLLKSQRITQTQKDIVKKERTRPFTQVVDTLRVTPAGAAITPGLLAELKTRVDALSPKEVAGLENSYLLEPEVLRLLGPDKLKELPEGKDDATRLAIGTFIRAAGATHPAHRYVIQGAGRGYFG